MQAGMAPGATPGRGGGEGGSWETHSFPTASSCAQVPPIQVSTTASKEAFISEDKDYSLVLTHAIGKRE